MAWRESPKPATANGGIRIEARDVAIDSRHGRLLEGVSVKLQPSVFAGLMGSTGAGKSTLIEVLSGYAPPSSGQVLYNGLDLYGGAYHQFGRRIGYQRQTKTGETLVHGDLTVQQAIFYSARLHTEMKRADLNERIGELLDDFEVKPETELKPETNRKSKTKPKLISKLSGGEQQRVRLIMALLRDPAVLFLDEPTSGLDTSKTRIVMKALRKVADRGTTILLTIHNPPEDDWQLMDRLLIVSKPDDAKPDDASRGATLTYDGSAYPKPDDVERLCADTRKGTNSEPVPPPLAQAARRSKKDLADGLSQWWTLVRRCLSLKLGDLNSVAVLVGLPLFALALIMLATYGQITKAVNLETWMDVAMSTGATVFLMTLAAYVFGCFIAAREVVDEWEIYHCERMGGLSIPAYVGSKIAVLGLLSAVQCVILLGLVHWLCEMRASWPWTLAVLILVSMVGVAVGLIISSAVRKPKTALVGAAATLLAMMVLGGCLRPLEGMPVPVQMLTNLIPARWGFEASVALEAQNRERKPSITAMDDDEKSESEMMEGERDMAHPYFPKNIRHGVITSMGALTLMFASLVIGIHLVLRVRDIH